jgi:succinyl-CoA synthetase alpha subunit
MQKVVIEKDTYFDSVELMLASQEIKKREGVQESVVAMATEMNVDLLRGMGFEADWGALSPNDLLIAVQAEEEQTAEEAVQAARELLQKKQTQEAEEEEYRPVSLEGALRSMPDANLVVISVPGRYAAREARKALRNGRHVMLFSDNVSLEEEVALKALAREKGLLMMGPDCGTAIINGRPLCFANVVRRGEIGIVGASGTGTQEVTCSIHRYGGGISQAIGTGGRDLRDRRVGGVTMQMGIEALGNDPATRVIVVISKPPEKELAGRVIRQLEQTGKPGVVHFIGLAEPHHRNGGIHFAASLEETARMAVALARGEEVRPLPPAEDGWRQLVERETARMDRRQRYLRGLFTGGTLADEAMILLERGGLEVYANIQVRPEYVLEDPRRSTRNTIVDLGDDTFTVGRPHPMIDPTIRTERIGQEMEDPEVALLLMDVVLGYGSHPDPAGALVEAVRAARRRAEERGGYLAVVATIVGTGEDFQNMEEQRRRLEEAGCIVMPSNYQASLLALKIMEEIGSKWT